jgi:uncharacterized protein YggE
MDKPNIFTYLVISALFLILGLLLAPKVINTQESNELFVTGFAKTKVSPTDAKIYITLESKDKSSELAFTKNISNYDLLTNYYSDLNDDFNDLRLETINFNVLPYYEYNKDLEKNELLGYTASHYLVFTIEDFEDKNILVNVLEKVSELDNSYITNLGFEVSEEQKEMVKKQLLADAMKDAWDKAKVLSNTGFFVLESVPKSVTINYNDYPIYYKSYDSYEFAQGIDLSRSIVPEEQEISANVNVVYKYN